MTNARFKRHPCDLRVFSLTEFLVALTLHLAQRIDDAPRPLRHGLVAQCGIARPDARQAALDVADHSALHASHSTVHLPASH